MTITEAGAKCDVCGNYILDPQDHVNSFKLEGIERMLHCDDKCKEKLKKAAEKNDWKMLPEGPLRNAFKEHAMTKIKETFSEVGCRECDEGGNWSILTDGKGNFKAEHSCGHVSDFTIQTNPDTKAINMRMLI